MGKLKTGEIISICSILASILVVAIKGETTPTTQIIIISFFAAFILGYGAYLIWRTIKYGKGVSSAAIITKAKKFTLQLLKLAKANAKQLKSFDFLAGQKSIEKQNKALAAKCRGDLTKLKTDGKFLSLREKLNNSIREYTILRSENYGDINAIKSYNKMYKVMSEASLVKQYDICNEIINRIFEMNRILLQVEQHNVRIKLGKYVVYFANDEEKQIKAYMDLIGWSYILIGDNKRGFDAILHAINIIENRIGDKYDGKIPAGVDPKTYYKYLFLKVRAYRHLGSTYYTYKNIDAMQYCNMALELIDSKGFKEGLNDDNAFNNMRCGILNNLYLCYFYKFITDSRKGRGDIDELKATLANINRDIEEVKAMPKESRDSHRMVKLLSLKCQLNKALDISGIQSIDMTDFAANLKEIENVLNKNIYFDDAMEVYTNQKVQQVFECVKNILIS